MDTAMSETQDTEMEFERGEGAIGKAFQNALVARTAALMPYFTLGYPDLDESLEIIRAIARHADLLELGVPFSDPIADGPTIQRSTQRALSQGVETAGCLEGVRFLREAGIDTPILLMGYYNPILAYGEQAYVNDAADAGADGFIVPDLPPEESKTLKEAARERGLALIYFLAPTSNEKRINLVSRQASGFVYLVSVTGVTGARTSLQYDLGQLAAKIQARSKLPVAVGFGISTPEQAADVADYADGVIVGSALIDAVDKADDKPAAAAEFVQDLARGLRRK
jgi:tryptophan synthase alpha chain